MHREARMSTHKGPVQPTFRSPGRGISDMIAANGGQFDRDLVPRFIGNGGEISV